MTPSGYLVARSEYVVLTRMVEYTSLIVENSLKSWRIAPESWPGRPKDVDP